jgi:cytochrome P450
VTRLHPTNPRITRAALADTSVGGEPVPAHTRVVLNVNAIARDPRYYEEPDRLLPDRWLDGRPHKFAYLSFGVGERRCLGEPFALAALTALLPALAAGRTFAFRELQEARRGRHQLAEGLRVTVSVC